MLDCGAVFVVVVLAVVVVAVVVCACVCACACVGCVCVCVFSSTMGNEVFERPVGGVCGDCGMTVDDVTGKVG